MHRPLIVFVLLFGVIILCNGCVTTSGSPQGRVAIVDSSSRAHLQSRLTMADFLAFSEQLTNKMLVSKQVARWGDQRPRLIVGNLLNNTEDENIVVAEIKNRVIETVFNSGIVRVVDESATQFDYIVTMELSEQRQRGENGRELAGYLLQMKLSALDGEMVGVWSDTLTMAKAERPLF